MEVAEAYRRLKLYKLPLEWISLVESGGWTTAQPFPTEYKSFLARCNLNQRIENFTVQLIRNLDDLTWNELSAANIDYVRLMCLFSTFLMDCNYSGAVSVSVEPLIISLQAGIAYLSMVTVRGSSVLNMFNSILYAQLIEHVRTACGLIRDRMNRLIIPVNSNKRKKDKSKNDTVSNESSGSVTIISPAEEEVLIVCLNKTLDVLVPFFCCGHVQIEDDCADMSVSALLTVCRLEIRQYLGGRKLEHIPSKTETYLAFKSFDVLSRIAPHLAGQRGIEQAICVVAKKILPILMVVETGDLSRPNYEISVHVKKNTIDLLIARLLFLYKEDSYTALERLIEYLCYMVPDKAEFRQKTYPIVCDVMARSPDDLFRRQLYKIAVMCHMDDMKIRLFAVELITKFLLENDSNRIPPSIGTDNGGDEGDLSNVVNCEFLMAIIFYLCRDVSANVKTKAISSLEKFIENRHTIGTIRRVFVDPYVNEFYFENNADYLRPIFDTQTYLAKGGRNLTEEEIENLTFLPGAKAVLNMLYNFMKGKKLYVRKSALQTLGKIILLNQKLFNNEISEQFLERCRDFSIMIRKCAAKVITDLIKEFPEEQSIVTLYVNGVIPLCLEEDTKHQDKLIPEMFPVLFNNLKSLEYTNSVLTKLPWNVIHEALIRSKTQHLNYIISKWNDAKLIREKVINDIYSHVDTRNDICAWFLLSAITKIRDVPNPQFIYEKFLRRANNLDVPQSHFIMESLYAVCLSLDEGVQLTLLHHLKTFLIQCRLPFKLIPIVCDICLLIVSHSSIGSAKMESLIKWCQPLIDICEIHLIANCTPSTYKIRQFDRTVQFIILIGEIGCYSSRKLSPSLYEIFDTFLLLPEQSQQVEEEEMEILSEFIRPAIALTAAKLCFTNELYLEKVLPKFRVALRTEYESVNLKLNIIYSLCDLCSSYTSAVEPYFEDICLCFTSPHDQLRIASLRTIIKNIEECYIKVKAWVVYPLFMTMLDENAEVINVVNQFLNSKLKQSILAHFAGFFFYANKHPSMDQTADQLSSLYSLQDDNVKRRSLYSKIMNTITGLSHRVLIWQKINVEVIGKVVDGFISLNEQTSVVLEDAFIVLAENERSIREQTSASRNAAADEDLEEEDHDRDPSNEISIEQFTNMRVSLMSSVVSNIFKMREKLRTLNPEMYKRFLGYVSELRKNFTESTQEAEPLFKNDHLINDIKKYFGE